MAEKMTDVNRMIRELEEADIDDDGVCVRYFPYKSDVPILVNALKVYRGFMTENKMAEVAKMFGKKLNEEFSVKDKYKTEWHCKFTKRGLMYLDKTFFDWQESGDYLLQDLLTGRAVIVGD